MNLWSSEDERAFRAHVERVERSEDPERELAKLVDILLSHGFKPATGTSAEGRYGVVLLLDGWYSRPTDAQSSVEWCHHLLDRIHELVDQELGRREAE